MEMYPGFLEKQLRLTFRLGNILSLRHIILPEKSYEVSPEPSPKDKGIN